MQLNILESKNRLSELVQRAVRGEEVLIANRGVPMVRLVPVSSPKAPVRDVVSWLERNPLPVTARRDAEQLDAQIEQERQAWD